MEKAILEKGLDGRIKMISNILGIAFAGTTLEEKEQFVSKHSEELSKIIDIELDATYEVFTGQVKVFRLNDCDWVAAKSLEDAITWYKANIVGEDEKAIYDEHEVTDLTKFMITLDVLSEDNVDYKALGHLQRKYLEHKEDATYKVPSNELLEVEWRGTPFIFASSEVKSIMRK